MRPPWNNNSTIIWFSLLVMSELRAPTCFDLQRQIWDPTRSLSLSLLTHYRLLPISLALHFHQVHASTQPPVRSPVADRSGGLAQSVFIRRLQLHVTTLYKCKYAVGTTCWDPLAFRLTTLFPGVMMMRLMCSI